MRDGTKKDIEQQIKQIDGFLGSGNWQRIKTYIEPHSHNPHLMPQLELAFKYAIRKKASLVASRIGYRLKNLRFIDLAIDAQVNHGVKVFARDASEDAIDMRVIVAISNAHRAEVSRNTKAALRKLKEEGVKLGNPDLAAATRKASKARSVHAIKYARTMQPMIKEIQQFGDTTLQEIANALNHRGIPSRFGKTWYASSVSNLLKQIKELR